jgi:hypothetical protein
MRLHTRKTIRKSSGTFARGTYALFDCERCGLTFPYTEMKLDPNTLLKVCDECCDIPDPHIYTYSDAEALKNSTPKPEFANNYYRELVLGESLALSTGQFVLTINALGDLTLLDIDRVRLYGVPQSIGFDEEYIITSSTANTITVDDTSIVPDSPTTYTKPNYSIKYELYKA